MTDEQIKLDYDLALEMGKLDEQAKRLEAQTSGVIAAQTARNIAAEQARRSEAERAKALEKQAARHMTDEPDEQSLVEGLARCIAKEEALVNGLALRIGQVLLLYGINYPGAVSKQAAQAALEYLRDIEAEL